MFVTQLTRVFEGLSGKVVRIKDLHWLAISQSHGSKGAWEFKRQKKKKKIILLSKSLLKYIFERKKKKRACPSKVYF
jgi:hypothetical protein